MVSGPSASTTPKGIFRRNDQDSYSVNNLTAKNDDAGSVTIQFGGCDGRSANCLPIMPGWNYVAHLYRPRQEILEVTWKFSEAEPVN